MIGPNKRALLKQALKDVRECADNLADPYSRQSREADHIAEYTVKALRRLADAVETLVEET